MTPQMWIVWVMWERRQQTLLLEEETWGYWWATHTHLPFSALSGTLFILFILFIAVLISVFSNVAAPVLILERQCVYRRGWDRKTAALGFDRRVNEFCCMWLSGQSGGQFNLNRRNWNRVSVFSWAVTLGDSRTFLCLLGLSQTMW